MSISASTFLPLGRASYPSLGTSLLHCEKDIFNSYSTESTRARCVRLAFASFTVYINHFSGLRVAPVSFFFLSVVFSTLWHHRM